MREPLWLCLVIEAREAMLTMQPQAHKELSSRTPPAC
jgi:hypothetical protein